MASVSGLDSYFTSLISDLMVLERQPLKRLQTQKDTLNLRSAAYKDVSAKLNDLQSAVKALISTSTSYAITTGRRAAVSNVASGYSVLTASASSSAVPGTYNIEVTTLAKEHRIRSNRMTYADQPLGLTAGSLLLGGAENRSAALVSSIANTVSGFSVAADPLTLDTGQTELGSGDYFVEVDFDSTDSTWKFRLVDADSQAVSVKQSGSSPATYTSGWQAIPSGGGEYDTGRGLKINFGTDPGSYVEGNRSSVDNPAARVTYTAKGVQVDVDSQDSLNSIASDINNAVYAQGMGITATVVDNMLILASKSSGTNHKLAVSDKGAGTVLAQLGFIGGDPDPEDADGTDGFTHTLQAASDASFKINGISVTRSQNTSLTNVINGVTLNLAADAEKGKYATLTVSADWSAARSKVDSFITKFNDVQQYLALKTSIDSTTISGVTTYTRAALADDNIFSELRGDLFKDFMDDVSEGALKSLREIGITIDDNLQATISDSAKLEAALDTNLGSVQTLLDKVMQRVDDRLSRFTGKPGETGYLNSVTSSITNEISEIDDDIADMEAYLIQREQSLTSQYAELQAMLMTMSYTQQMWSSIYGSVNRSY